MAAAGQPVGTGDDKPSFSFEQFVLRLVVGIMFLALLVMAVELGHVRGRIGRLETGGAPVAAPAEHAPLGSPQTIAVVLKEMEVDPKVVEVPAGTAPDPERRQPGPDRAQPEP